MQSLQEQVWTLGTTNAHIPNIWHILDYIDHGMCSKNYTSVCRFLKVKRRNCTIRAFITLTNVPVSVNQYPNKKIGGYGLSAQLNQHLCQGHFGIQFYLPTIALNNYIIVKIRTVHKQNL